ncbi:HET-domain-containing protein [Hypoxylon sp. FL1150]|nr:HET-domain-containing protein [Hypoxylon sp. FL1150]
MTEKHQGIVKKRRSARLRAIRKRSNTNGRLRGSAFSNCKICQRILYCLTTPPSIDDMPCYPLRQALNTECKSHIKLIIRPLNNDVNPDKHKITVSKWPGENSTFLFAWANLQGENCLYRISGDLRLFPTLRYKPDLWGNLVNSNWISYGLIRRWKRRCIETHTCSSANLDHLTEERPLWVVDTWLQCLVPYSSSITYVALSYVWGDFPTFKTSRDNVDYLQKPSSLADGSTDPPIPLTIRHAMAFVQKMGERYLWVDALCIIQDNDAHKHTEITKMAAIYANASVTIIVSDVSNSNSGINALPGISDQRSVKQTVHSLTRNLAVIETDYYRGTSSIWSKRGWTLQERLFSRRRIVFQQNWVRWECQCATWNEISNANNLFDDDKPSIFAAKEVPDVEELSKIITEYNTMELTFPEDALLAFSGIASALGRTYNGLISGIPVSLFHIGLLWQPVRTLRQRIPKHPKVDPCLPTWSWAGWEGRIRCWEEIAADFVKKSSKVNPIALLNERVFPLVQWSWLEEQNGTQTPIRDSWYEYKSKFWNKLTDSCPPGWTRHCIENPAVEDDWRGKPQPEIGVAPLCFYTHESEPGSEFWFPLPSCDTNQQTKTHIFASFISCKTRRAWLVAGEAVSCSDPTWKSQSPLKSLRDQVGRWAGLLMLHEPLDREMEQNADGLVTIELVEVACGHAYNDVPAWDIVGLEEWDLEERPKDGRFYEYYYVLWIEWKNGIAYRKGIGRVEKNAWERQEREWIDLVLG